MLISTNTFSRFFFSCMIITPSPTSPTNSEVKHMERDPARATLVLPATCREAGEACLRNGFAFPVRVLSEADASEALDNLEDYTTSCGGTLTGDARFKLHLLLPWAWKIVHHPTMVGLAKASLGTDDVWCWSSDINAKEPGTMTHYTWHQDATYAGISPPSAAVTVWLCLSESTELSGAVKCIPQSHSTQVRHVENKGGQENALAMGQEVATFPDGCDPSAAVTMVSIHSILSCQHRELSRLHIPVPF